MPFSNDFKSLMKNIYQFKEYVSQKMVKELSKINCDREQLGTLLKRFGQQKAPSKGMRAAD